MRTANRGQAFHLKQACMFNYIMNVIYYITFSTEHLIYAPQINQINFIIYIYSIFWGDGPFRIGNCHWHLVIAERYFDSLKYNLKLHNEQKKKHSIYYIESISYIKEAYTCLITNIQRTRRSFLRLILPNWYKIWYKAYHNNLFNFGTICVPEEAILKPKINF